MSASPILLTISCRIEARPERVFDAWLDPASAGRWLFATPEGQMKRVAIDPRVGGKFHIDEQRGDTLVEHVGEYLELRRPHRLAFAFSAMEGSEPTKVVVDIVAEDEGSLLTLTHELDPKWASYEDRTREGWTMILSGLAKAVE